MIHKYHGNMFVLIGLYIGNFFYSVSKRSLNVSFPLLKTQMGATNAHMGDMSSEFSFAYGVSKLLGGVLSDLFPSYTLFTLGLYIGAILNLCIAGASNVSSIGFLWMLNGLGQGPGGPALSRLVIEHWPAKSRASVWSSLTFACNVGYLLSTAVMTPYLYFGWQGPFVSVGVASLLSSILMSIMYVLFLRHTSIDAEPTSITDPTENSSVDNSISSNTLKVEEKQLVTENKVDETCAINTGNSVVNENGSTTTHRANQHHNSTDQNSTTNSNTNTHTTATTMTLPKESWYRQIIASVRNTRFSALIALKCVLLFVANTLSYFVSKGIQDWIALYLVEYLHYQEGPRLKIWELIIWNEVGGIAGAICVGAVSDLLHNRKSLTSGLFAVICILGLWALALHLPIYESSETTHMYDPIHSLINSMSNPDSVDTLESVNLDISFLGDNGNPISTLLEPSEHPTELALTIAYDSHIKTADTCLDPSSLLDTNELSMNTLSVDTTNIAHPLEQCKSVLLHTVYVLFPQAGPTTLSASRFMTTFTSRILAILSAFVTIDRYFTMRCALFWIGFGFNGPKTLVMFELVELVPKQLCGTLNGVAGFFGQVGATYAGTFIAHTIIQEGWCSFVALLTLASTVMAMLLFVSALI